MAKVKKRWTTDKIKQLVKDHNKLVRGPRKLNSKEACEELGIKSPHFYVLKNRLKNDTNSKVTTMPTKRKRKRRTAPVERVDLEIKPEEQNDPIVPVVLVRKSQIEQMLF